MFEFCFISLPLNRNKIYELWILGLKRFASRRAFCLRI